MNIFKGNQIINSDGAYRALCDCKLTAKQRDVLEKVRCS